LCIIVCDNAKDACKNSDLVVTDVWASMGQENEQAKRALESMVVACVLLIHLMA
jgi:ornithine carbamoyltransferase